MSSISIVEFLAETKDDFNSPTTSTFTSKMGLCRATISSLEESLDADRSALKKMKTAVKAMYNSGSAHTSNEENFTENLERLGSLALNNNKEPEPDIGAAFLKLAVFTKELTSLLKNLVSNFNRVVIFPLESLLKGDLKGIKGDMKRPFDKSWKDYDTKVKQVEREKRQLAKEAGMIRNEISGGEIAEEMEKERRMFQLQMCDYLIKANEIKTKKGVDLLQHLVDYYHAQNTFFNEGCRVTEQFKLYFTELSSNLHSIRQSQDEERRQLVELRHLLRSAVGDSNAAKPGPGVYNLHQLQGLKEFGNEKTGSLMKRSEGLRRAWQKRKCTVSDGFLTISHNNMSKPPVKLNLLTSQVKPVPEDKRIFDLVSHNRTYRFMADDEADALAWVSVISNNKEDALNRVFDEEGVSKEQNTGLKELTKSILDEVKSLPGNDKCCDCGAQDPTWLSTNLGVLICIECSGIHRDMGVHISRIQSITLDELGTSELLVARSMGNVSFNDIMEAKLDPYNKPDASSDMETRKSFIRDKYEMHRFAMQTCLDNESAMQDLLQSLSTRDISTLLQVFAEGVDMSQPLPGSSDEETALHLAIRQADRATLSTVDFIIQNSSQCLNKQTLHEGSTPLHLCAQLNKTECMKLLLRTRAKVDIKNSAGEKPIDVARRTGNKSCEELLTQAAAGKFHTHVNAEWNLSFKEDDDDFPPDNSDDDIDGEKSEKASTLGSQYNNSPFKPPGPTPSSRSRPVSAINPGVPTNVPTPEISSRLRPTSFKDRSRPNVPVTNHGLSPSTALPPGRPALPSPNAQNINRNRSRTVAPVPTLKEHKRTSSDTRAGSSLHPPPLPVHQGKNAMISNALENLLNRPPPPVPAHNPPIPASRPTAQPPPSHVSRALPPPASTQEPRRDSFGESSGKGATKKYLIKKYSMLKSRRKTRSSSENGPSKPHHTFSILSSIQNALKHQGKSSRRSLDSNLQSSTVTPRNATLPASPLTYSYSKSIKFETDKKQKRRSGNFTVSSNKQTLSSCRSLESLLSKESVVPSDERVVNLQSLCLSPPPSHVKIINPHSPPVAAYINPSYNVESFKTNPLYTNYDVGMCDDTSRNIVGSHTDKVVTTNLNATYPLPFSSPYSMTFPAENANMKRQAREAERKLAVETHSYIPPASLNQSLINAVLSKPQAMQQPPSPIPPALPDKMANRELPPPPVLPRSSGSGSRPKRVKAVYDCEADNPDELTFVENEIIVVTGVEDQEWWVGYIEHLPHRSGVFPVSFVQPIPD